MSENDPEIDGVKEEYRSIRKVSLAHNASPMKQSCPYHREDAVIAARPVMQQGSQQLLGSPSAPRLLHTAPLGGPESGGWRFDTSAVNFEASLRRGGPTSSYLVKQDDIHVPVAEKVPEARRDWTYVQEKPIVETILPQWSLTKSPSNHSLLSRTSLSVRSLGSQATQLNQMNVPIHSVRVRQAQVPGKTRESWKYF